MRIFGWILGGLVVLSFVGLVGRAIRVAMLPVRAIDRTIETGEGVIDKTLTADNAIYNYEWFKQTLEDIKALKAKTEIADKAVESFKIEAGPRDKWTFEDKTESARLAAVAQGLRSQTEDVMATYNARAKMANRNIFLDGKLPNALEWASSFLK